MEPQYQPLTPESSSVSEKIVTFLVLMFLTSVLFPQMASIIGLNFKKDKNKKILISYFDDKNVAFKFQIEEKIRDVKELENNLAYTDTLSIDNKIQKRLENLNEFKRYIGRTFFDIQMQTWQNLKRVNFDGLDLQSDISAYQNNMIQFVNIISEYYSYTSTQNSKKDSLTLSTKLQLESEDYFRQNDSIINHIKKQITDY